MKIAIYVRVSTAEQTDNYSIGEQIDRLTKYAEARDWVIYKVYTDGGYSGTNTDRPALQDLLKDAKDKRFDGVLVYKLDRLSRNQRDTLEIIEDILIPNKIDFVSMSENLDTSSPFGKMIISILSAFSQLEVEVIKERMAIGIEGRAKEGKWHGSKFTPVGYEYINGKLEIIEYEAMLVRKAFEMFNNRIPVNRICNDFKGKGHKHRYGYWVAPTLKNALKNKTYLGYINHNGKTYKGQHTAIIDEETYNKAQQIFEERNRDNPKHKNAFKYNSALAGLLICKHCGARYCKQNGWRKANGEQTHHYSCYSRAKKSKNQIKNPNCKNKIWNMKTLDSLIFNEVAKLAFDTRYIEEIKNISNEDVEKKEQVEVIDKRIKELSSQISRFTDLYSLGELDIEEIKAKIEPLTNERKSLKAELEYLRKSSDITTQQTLELAQSFGEVLENGNLDEIRFTLEELIESIILDNEKITINWNFA